MMVYALVSSNGYIVGMYASKGLATRIAEQMSLTGYTITPYAVIGAPTVKALEVIT